jgi:hypothetical protein
LKNLANVFLNLFGRIHENNEDLYNIVVGQVFGHSNEALPLKTPTFCDREKIEDILYYSNCLNENGINVF